MSSNHQMSLFLLLCFVALKHLRYNQEELSKPCAALHAQPYIGDIMDKYYDYCEQGGKTRAQCAGMTRQAQVPEHIQKTRWIQHEIAHLSRCGIYKPQFQIISMV